MGCNRARPEVGNNFGGTTGMMQARLRVAFWILAAALIGATAPACAPKRIVQPPATTAPVPEAKRTATAPPQGKVSTETLPATPVGEIADEAADEGGESAGPPVPGDLPQTAASVAADAEPGDRVAELARTQVGKPYGWGGTGPERFDCSGLATYVYRQLGIALPRVSLELASTGAHVDRSELKPGDLVFFSLRSAFDHVGIFLGNNRFVHAPRRQEPVRVDNLDDAWWNRAYRGARRVFGGEP
jgi:cell wall-associated NlpC family hydrolase